jgi:hypothetical protein
VREQLAAPRLASSGVRSATRSPLLHGRLLRQPAFRTLRPLLADRLDDARSPRRSTSATSVTLCRSSATRAPARGDAPLSAAARGAVNTLLRDDRAGRGEHRPHGFAAARSTRPLSSWRGRSVLVVGAGGAAHVRRRPLRLGAIAGRGPDAGARRRARRRVPRSALDRAASTRRPLT